GLPVSLPHCHTLGNEQNCPPVVLFSSIRFPQASGLDLLGEFWRRPLGGEFADCGTGIRRLAKKSHVLRRTGSGGPGAARSEICRGSAGALAEANQQQVATRRLIWRYPGKVVGKQLV